MSNYHSIIELGQQLIGYTFIDRRVIYLVMPSLTIWIENKNSYDLATELVLSLQESKAVVVPVSAPQSDDLRTTLDFPELQHDARERIMREASNWANTKGLKSIPKVGMQDSEASYLTIL